MTAAAQAKPVVTKSRALWRGAHIFEAGPEGRTAPIDGDAKSAPGPVETLLNAVATCSAVDVVDILTKRRTPPSHLEILVTATRRSIAPRRVQELEFEYRIDGTGIEVEQAERAIELAFDKYCSVAASLAPDIIAQSRLVLNGEPHEPRKRIVGG